MSNARGSSGWVCTAVVAAAAVDGAMHDIMHPLLVKKKTPLLVLCDIICADQDILHHVRPCKIIEWHVIYL